MATPAANVITKASIPTKIYQLLIKSAEPFVPKKLHPLWNHPAGNLKHNDNYWYCCSFMSFQRLWKMQRIENVISFDWLGSFANWAILVNSYDFKVRFSIVYFKCAHVTVYITNGIQIEILALLSLEIAMLLGFFLP